MSTTSWRGQDAEGNSIAFAAEQPNPGGPLTSHFVLEINGSPVAGPVPVSDSAAEASLATIAENGATAENQIAATEALSAIATNTAAGATAVNQATANTTLATIAINTAQGTAGSGITQPTGGGGILGWLSGIYRALTGTLAVTDSNSAAFQGSTLITPGAAFTAGRSVGFVCTAAGNITLTLPDGSTMTFGISVNPDLQTLSFAATNLALGSGAAGTFWSLK
jgi:hypothetical protein